MIKHPFTELQAEYDHCLANMVVTRPEVVDHTARRLVDLYKAGRYGAVSAETGIPLLFIAPSFEREASSNFALSPAQGDRWDRASIHVPAHRGPFKNWHDAAIDAYHINGLDKVGSAAWVWALLCYYGELFNGMGYRAHGLRTPYLFGGTNLQQAGKYTSDGHFERVMDTQLGIIPMAMRMVQLAPELALVAGAPWPFPATATGVDINVAKPVPEGLHDAKWLQHALNLLGQQPALREDGSYGQKTMLAVLAWQRSHSLTVDGVAGPQTRGSVADALAALPATH